LPLGALLVFLETDSDLTLSSFSFVFYIAWLMSKSSRFIKFLVDESIPVVKTLGETFGGVYADKGVKSPQQRGRAGRGITPRIDVISEKLCGG